MSENCGTHFENQREKPSVTTSAPIFGRKGNSRREIGVDVFESSDQVFMNMTSQLVLQQSSKAGVFFRVLMVDASFLRNGTVIKSSHQAISSSPTI
ncbi:hypothetical protein AVEN_72913-1 [Araneus ventricosus]|uniref:Uncharacterized protein n=1 Tax=Araneus ventricosus TaxID=182803 RepID=A0A4Y2GVC7_ARAVE|nr:hypothetical protein AVEN_72913-1 [Araneus ventricosus]